MKWKQLLGLPLLVLLGAMLLTLLCAGQLEKLSRSLSYYLGEPTGAEQQVMAYARENGISYAEYPASLIGLLERNPETEEFVLGYPFREEARADLSVMHPLPRVNEISVAVDDDPRACYFKQVLNGKYMRMALILKLLEDAKNGKL